MKIFAGYGSTKDISVYTSIGLPSSQIYIVGRPSKKMQHQCQVPFDYFRNNLPNLNESYLTYVIGPLTSSSQRDTRLICPSWSTTTVLGQPSPAAHAWCYVKAASAWVQTATSWGRGTTCYAPSPPNRPPAPRQAASTTDQSAHRANQTASGWRAFTATARRQHSAAWASQPAAGAAAAAPSWIQAFSAPNEITEMMWEDLRGSDWKYKCGRWRDSRRS